MDRLHEAARRETKRIVLTDGLDRRVVDAATQLVAGGLATPTLMIPKGHTGSLDHDLDVIESDHPLEDGAELVADGGADGMVAGATLPTSTVIRAAMRRVGVAPGHHVSSSFLMVFPDGRAVAYGDCSVVPDPNATRLAYIATETAATFEDLTGEQARVAMLSFSTHGSANHPMVTKVREATEMVREQRPDLIIDGELQFDAAFVPSVAASKAPDSPIAGDANVFIFPNLDAANIAYKITERMAHASALGPLLQGLIAPVHDLSRGCSVDDIVNVSVIAAVQAQHRSA